jgi:hypothetical protein
MHDTRPDAAARQREAIRRMPPGERLRLALAMSESLRAASLEALRRRHPGESMLELVARLSGEPMVSRVRRGPLPGR